MNIMGCRLINLQETLAGYLQTGVPFIAAKGSYLAQPLTGDDIGIYILIPKIAHLFNLSIERAITLFFSGVLLAPLFIGIIGFCFLYRNWAQRCISIVGLLLLARFAYAIGDVYLAFYACAISIIPWCLYIYSNRVGRAKLALLGAFTGFLVGCFHFIRAFSGFGPLLFCLIILVTGLYTKKEKILFLLVLFGAFTIPYFYFHHSYRQSVNYLETMGLKNNVEQKHVFWHQVYIGFGLINFKNEENISYDDAVAANKVKSIDNSIGYCSAQYEETLKNEVFKLIKSNWSFLLLTFFAKLGIMIYFLLKFANFGIFAAWIYRKPLIIDYAFLVALFWNSMFCFIAIPISEYALGFISCAVLWGIISINVALETIKKKSHVILNAIFANVYSLTKKERV